MARSRANGAAKVKFKPLVLRPPRGGGKEIVRLVEQAKAGQVTNLTVRPDLSS